MHPVGHGVATRNTSRYGLLLKHGSPNSQKSLRKHSGTEAERHKGSLNVAINGDYPCADDIPCAHSNPASWPDCSPSMIWRPTGAVIGFQEILAGTSGPPETQATLHSLLRFTGLRPEWSHYLNRARRLGDYG